MNNDGDDRQGRSKRHNHPALKPREAVALPLPETATLDMLAPDLALFTFQSVDAALPSALTEAEQDVALRLYLGQSSEQIARARNASTSTIANQLEAIYRKLHVSSRAELALLLRGRPSNPRQ
jgi:DNA-binding CsgD family transcriptional regulator